MKKGLIVFAIILILAGGALFWGVLASVGYDYTKLSTAKAETNTYTTEGSFDKIIIDTKTTDVNFALSEDGTFSVVCTEAEKMKHTVTIENGVLRIVGEDNRKWFEHINFFLKNLTMTVYLPATEYESLLVKVSTGDVNIPKTFTFGSIAVSDKTGNVSCYASTTERLVISTSTGNIKVENAHATTAELLASTGNVKAESFVCDDNMEARTSTGNIYLTDVTCKNLNAKTSTGNIVLKNVIAAEKFTLKASTGNIKFDRCDATEIEAKTSTGNITGTLLTPKMFVAGTGTGRVSVPATVSDQKCELTASTGDIRISIAE